MQRAVFLDAASMGDADLSMLNMPAIALTCFDSTEPGQIIPRLQDAAIALVNKVQLTAHTLQQLPALKLICITATGTNNVDLSAAERLGIAVTNVRGYADTAVPQHVMALLLQLTNKVAEYHSAVLQGRWSQSSHFCLLDYPVTELAGKTLVIVGYGALGQATAKLATAFGMQVVVAEQPGASYCRDGRVEFMQALSQADVISLHCPLTDTTAKLINQSTLAKMKPGALLINTARGGLIDEDALLHALTKGKLAGAALDVLTREPPQADNALILSALPNLIITPHMAWASAEARQRMVLQLRDILHSFVQGEIKNQVWSAG